MINPRILVISNNCLSEHNSNGRTLLRLLEAIPQDRISSIYTSGETAEEKHCGAVLHVTNKDAVISYVKRPAFNTPKADDLLPSSSLISSGKKTAFNMLLRDLVWNQSLRLRRAILKWARNQQPDLLLLQLGDAALHIRLALYIAQEMNIPILTYNTEDYYFKKYDYMRRAEYSGMMYRLFHRRFCRAFDEMMRRQPRCLYNCVGLKERYDQAFGCYGEVIYCGSDFKQVKSICENGSILYAGNLGVGRHITLMMLGRALQAIDNSLFLDVFGEAPADILEKLRLAPGIRYCGYVSYAKVQKKMAESRLLVHVESFDPFTVMDTRYAFSTKIADYMMSGIPILYCGPISGEGAAYLSEHNMAFIISNQDQCNEQLSEALFNAFRRKQVAENALRLAHENHDLKTIHKQFVKIIAGIPDKERQYE